MEKNTTSNGYWASRLESQTQEAAPENSAAAIAAWAEPFPKLAAFLAGGNVDGKLIPGGTLLVSVAADGLKVGLHCRYTDKWAWDTPAPGSCPLVAAEGLAGCDPKRWRVSKGSRLAR